MISGVHDFPQVRAAGSAGNALNSKKVITLTANSSPVIVAIRLRIYLSIVVLYLEVG
jgi:hypothetical protein